MNKLLSQGISLFRRLSVFYLFFVSLLLVFFLYQYKVKPANEAELTGRGQRVLHQISLNFIQKASDLRNIFVDSSSGLDNLMKPKNNLAKLYESTPFSVDTAKKDTTQFAGGPSPYFRNNSTGNWDICFPVGATGKKDNPKHFRVVTDLNQFAMPLFGVREDIFETFLLLLDTATSPGQGSREFPVLYYHDNISASPNINLDTLKSIQKNSDFSGLAAISIAGKSYEVFVQPFRFYNHRVLVAGLLSQDSYANQLSATPVYFIPVCIISILLMLILLPFIKMFFLSAEESVNKRDLRAIILSFYLGSALLLLIVFYLVTTVLLQFSYNNKLANFGDQIQSDMATELLLAGKQLRYYDSVYQRLSPDKKIQLSNPAIAASPDLNQMLAPKYWKGVTRLFWIDKEGNTLAKWNAYNFNAPLTKVGDLDFFKLLKDGYPKLQRHKQNAVEMYAGKSNITHEFQVYFSMPTDSMIVNPVKPHQPMEAYGIVLAGNIAAASTPVIPGGFGFCLIDSTGKVLVHADPDRNLSENILEESDNDQTLVSGIQFKNSDHFINHKLYGIEVVSRVIPIKRQSLYLVVYYGKKYLSDHILRALQFTAVVGTALMILILLCLWLATLVHQQSSRLPFLVSAIEWVRPSYNNVLSYKFSIRYFTGLFILFVGSLIIILALNIDITALLWIAILIPFYCQFGFIYSRKQITDGNNKKIIVTRPRELIQMLMFTTVSLVGINVLFICSTPLPFEEYLAVAIFNLIAIGLFVFSNKTILNNGMVVQKNEMTNKYRQSLGLSILLIGIFPVCGILLYGWSAECLQMRKERLLQMGHVLDQRNRYYTNDFAPDIKPEVLATLGGDTYLHELVYKQGLYLLKTDHIAPAPVTNENADSNKSNPIGDEVFYKINSRPFRISASAGLLPIRNNAADDSWYFSRDNSSSSLRLFYKGPGGQNPEDEFLLRVSMEKPLVGAIQDFPFLILFVLAFVVIFLFFGQRLMSNIVNRLFLQDYASAGKINVDGEYLSKLFKEDITNSSYLQNAGLPTPFDMAFFEREYAVAPNVNPTTEELIIDMTDHFSSVYAAIWRSLDPREKMVLYDFSTDRLTNYKNTNILFRLIQKGLLKIRNGTLDLFAASFRNYVLTRTKYVKTEGETDNKQGTGIWSAIKIPIFSVIGVVGIFILATQNETTHRITGFLASVTALFPLLMKLFEKKGGGDNAA